MTAETGTPTRPRRVDAAKRGTPELDPALLMFLHDVTLINNDGQLVITATYPSWSKKGMLHRVTVRDDGSAVGCTCTGYGTHGKCYHLGNAEEIAREYQRREYRRLPNSRLKDEDNWFASQPAGSLDAALRLQLDAMADVIGERLLMQYGWAEAPKEQSA